MAPPDRPDDGMAAYHLRNPGEARRFDLGAIPDEEHGDIDVRDGHLVAEQEVPLDMRFDEAERLAHAAIRGAS